MTESLYNQIAAAEATMSATEIQAVKLRELQAALAEVVGRAEAAEGRIVVEVATGGGLKTLELDPMVMRMPSVDLAGAIKYAIEQAQADLRAQARQRMAELGVTTAMPSPEEMRSQLTQIKEQVISTARAAAAGLDAASQRLAERGTR